MSKLGIVLGFEIKRSVKKKNFWFTTIIIPIIFIVIFFISYKSSSSTNSSIQTQDQNYFKSAKVGIFDQTGLISAKAVEEQHIAVEPSQAAGISAVKDGNLTAFFYYPKNISKEGIQVYAQDQGITFSPPYNDAASAILNQFALTRINALTHDNQIVNVLLHAPSVNAVTYKDGVQTKGVERVFAPGAIWITFLVLVVLLSYFAISATTEEKENRAAEILLTSVKSRTLLIGKILSIFVIAFFQLVIIIVPLLIGYLVFKNHISLPGGVTLGHIPLSAQSLIVGFLFLVFGMSLFVSILVGFGSLFPSAQEASRYLFIVIIWAFIPIYSLSYIVSTPNAPIVKIFTYFPMSAPSTVLLRNAVGTIPNSQVAVSFILLLLANVLSTSFAIRAFQYGAMEYGRKITLKEILRS